MTRSSAINALLGEARSHVFNARTGAGVSETDGPNRSPFIDAANRLVGAPMGSPWCASFEAKCATDALPHGVWPVPLTAGCDVILAWARKRGILHREALTGDLFLILNPHDSDDATHTGIVDALTTGGVKTIEGNTNDNGSREGVACMQRTRAYSQNIVFVRWASLIDDVTDDLHDESKIVGGSVTATWKVTFGPVGSPTDTLPGYVFANVVFADMTDYLKALFGDAAKAGIGYDPQAGATWQGKPIPQTVARRVIAGQTYIGVRAFSALMGLYVAADADSKTAHIQRAATP